MQTARILKIKLCVSLVVGTRGLAEDGLILMNVPKSPAMNSRWRLPQQTLQVLIVVGEMADIYMLILIIVPRNPAMIAMSMQNAPYYSRS